MALTVISGTIAAQPLNNNFSFLQDLPRTSIFRNALINGNFDIWQRGTSFTNPASASFLADRYITLSSPGSSGALPNVTISRQALTPGDIANAFNHMRTNVDGAGTQSATDSFYTIRQKIEFGTRYLSGNAKKVTLSFWARSSIANKKLAVNIKQNYGSGGAPTAEEELTGTVFNLTSSWAKHSFTFTTNTLVGKTFGTNDDDNLTLLFWLEWGSTFNTRFGAGASESFVGAGNIDIAQVQVSAGDTALPFQPKSFAEELMSSQRYYEKSYNQADVPGSVTTNAAIQGVTEDGTSTGSHFGTTPFKVRKRTLPTVTIFGTGGTANTVNDQTADRAIGAGNFAITSEIGMNHNYTLTGPTSGRRSFHFTADAEL